MSGAVVQILLHMPAQAVHKLDGSSYFTRCRHSVDKPIFFTDHSLKRLEGKRQSGITQEDVIAAARSIPGTVVTPTRFKNFRSAAGRLFDIVICDMGERRIIVTIIGKGG